MKSFSFTSSYLYTHTDTYEENKMTWTEGKEKTKPTTKPQRSGLYQGGE